MLKLEVNFLYRVATKCYNSALSQGKLLNARKKDVEISAHDKKDLKKKKKKKKFFFLNFLNFLNSTLLTMASELATLTVAFHIVLRALNTQPYHS